MTTQRVSGLLQKSGLIAMAMTFLVVGSWETRADERTGISDFRRLFKILDTDSDYQELHNRATWPDNDLLTSYLEFDLLSLPEKKPALASLHSFIRRWPDHPQAEKIRRTLDNRYLEEGTPSEALAWYDNREMRFPNMQVRYLELLLKANRDTEAAKLWKNLYLSGAKLPAYITKETKSFDHLLNDDDHETRAWLLVKSGRDEDLADQLYRLTKPKRAFFEVILTAQQGGKKFDKLLAALPKSEQSHPVVWAERIKGLYSHGKIENAVKLLEGAQGKLLKKEDRLSIRFKIARTYLFTKSDPKQALRIVKPNINESGTVENLEESFWLIGWSAYTTGDRKLAIESFSRLGKDGVSFALRSQGAYWAGKLRRENGENPKEWFRLAALSPETFYGLLAKEELDGSLTTLPSSPILCDLQIKERPEIKARLERMRILREAGRGHYVEGEILWLGTYQGITIADQLCLAEELNAPVLAVKTALQMRKELPDHPLYWNALFPIPDWSPLKGWRLNIGLVWSVVRQESRYQHRIESSAGASGLMQLMPATARQEAEKLGLPRATPTRLQEPEYNLELGQSYLRRMLQNFDGDLVLALAAYNAGPGRAAKWRKDRAEMDGLNFIERIPFTETRHYVKHIAHSLAAYRLRLDGSATLKGLIEQNMPGFSSLDYTSEG